MSTLNSSSLGQKIDIWPSMGQEKGIILVIDDEMTVARLFRSFLLRAGFAVDIATNSRQARKSLESRPYHAVLSDILIDDDSGIDLLHHCQKSYPDLPVVLVTGMPSTESAVAAVRLGAYDYLRKPVSEPELTSTMKRAVELCTMRRQNKQYAEEVQRYRQNLEEMVVDRTQALAESRDFLESILEALPHPFCVIDVATHRVVMANTAARIEERLAGLTCHKLFHGRETPCDQEEQACPLVLVAKTGGQVVMEHNHVDSLGRSRQVEIHGYPISDGEGRVVRMIQYNIDVTERRQLESIAESASLMENLGYIFAGIRHEIGNPINSIKVSLTVLEKRLAGYSRETIAEFLRRTLDEVARVEDLLRSFKSFSHHERARMIQLEVGEFMDKFMEFASGEIGKRGIDLVFAADERPFHTEADVTFLQQVMLNLTTNAAQAVEGADRPTIEIRLAKEPGWVVLSVTDNGCGMSEEDCRKAFMPFFTTKAHGTGLGLVIVRKILLKMNARIQLTSKPGKGTTVVVRLPELAHGE